MLHVNEMMASKMLQMQKRNDIICFLFKDILPFNSSNYFSKTVLTPIVGLLTVFPSGVTHNSSLLDDEPNYI